MNQQQIKNDKHNTTQHHSFKDQTVSHSFVHFKNLVVLTSCSLLVFVLLVVGVCGTSCWIFVPLSQYFLLFIFRYASSCFFPFVLLPRDMYYVVIQISSFLLKILGKIQKLKHSKSPTLEYRVRPGEWLLLPASYFSSAIGHLPL